MKKYYTERCPQCNATPMKHKRKWGKPPKLLYNKIECATCLHTQRR